MAPIFLKNFAEIVVKFRKSRNVPFRLGMLPFFLIALGIEMKIYHIYLSYHITHRWRYQYLLSVSLKNSTKFMFPSCFPSSNFSTPMQPSSAPFPSGSIIKLWRDKILIFLHLPRSNVFKCTFLYDVLEKKKYGMLGSRSSWCGCLM